MVKAIIANQARAEILEPTGRLRASREELFAALQTEDLTETHRFVLAEILGHIEYIEAEMAYFETQLLHGLASWQPLLVLPQRVPGIDQIGAAMRLVEIGTAMAVYGRAERLAAWSASVPATMRAPGNALAANPVRGVMPGCDDSSVNLPRPPRAVTAPCAISS